MNQPALPLIFEIVMLILSIFLLTRPHFDSSNFENLSSTTM